MVKNSKFIGWDTSGNPVYEHQITQPFLENAFQNKAVNPKSLLREFRLHQKNVWSMMGILNMSHSRKHTVLASNY